MKQTLPLLIFLLMFSSLFAQTANKATEFYKKGLDYKAKNMIPQAFAAFEKAIALNKKYDSAYVELGTVCLSGSYYDSAIFNFKKAIAISPKMASAHIALGNVYRLFKTNYDSAITCFKSALKTDSLNKETYYNVAWCYNSKLEYENAILYGKKALEIDNNYRQAYNELAHAYRRTNKFTECIEQFKKNLSVSVVDLALLYSGFCYTELKDKENALKEYEELKKINEKMAGSLRKAIDKMQ